MPYTYTQNALIHRPTHIDLQLRRLRTNNRSDHTETQIDPDPELARWLLDLGCWTAQLTNGVYYVVATNRHPENGLPRTLSMHRLLVNAPPRSKVYHLDGDTLNNRRANLSREMPPHVREAHQPTANTIEALRIRLNTAQLRIRQLEQDLAAERRSGVPPTPDRRAQSKRSWLRQYKLDAGCAECGYRADATLLQFHHVDPATKVTTIAQAAKGSWPALLAELAKCVVLCKPCHDARHPYGPY